MTRATTTSLDAVLEKISTIIGTLMEIENCQILGQVSQDSPYWMKNHRMDIHGPERLIRKQTTSRPDILWPEIWASKRKENQKWAIEKPRLDNACKPRGIYFNGPGDEENKDIMKNTRRKLEVPMPAAVPCKTQREKNSEKQCETKYACTVEADESMRKRMEGSLHMYHEDNMAGKGLKSLIHNNLVHKLEQGSSASQMTAAKVMNVISRLPGCAGQAADAASAYTQVRMENAPSLLKNHKIRMSRYLDTSTNAHMA